jgi:uncharacterized protein YdiU (UPF0061 family)
MPIKEKHYRPDPLLQTLGPRFADPVKPAAFPKQVLRYRNDRAARMIGLESLNDSEWVRHFGHFAPLPGNMEQPLAMRYHGHQFRTYNPDLGDGRGFLFAQMRDQQGRLLDLGTKGSGQTPWSRSGDGRLTLKGAIREVLATEMLCALGLDTSETFSVIETGEQLYRNDEPSPTRSAVLVRMSHSHIRIGSFQRHAYNDDMDAITALMNHAIEIYFPDLKSMEAKDRPAAFIAAVSRNVARLAAGFMATGFVHGVLNTDNINITGESFDYGPYRFVPTFDPGFTAAYFDQTGLYAYGRQPEALNWNLARLAECFLSLAPREALVEAIGEYSNTLNDELRRAYFRRLNLGHRSESEDNALLQSLLAFLQESQAPYEQVLFDWQGGPASKTRAEQSPTAEHYQTPAFKAFAKQLEAYGSADPERLRDPYFERARPCTLLIDEIEEIWAAIADRDDWSAFEDKITDIALLRGVNGQSS